ncbi:MAG TPA: SRPBCC family protein [Anaerolineae bacterium]|nr:SRPBCC family protein [Anaerolineae bacterium]
MRIQKTIEIAAPPESIWPFFVEPDRVLQWYSTFRKFEYSGDSRSGVGTPLYIEEQAMGPVMKMNFEVTQWKENEKLALHMVSGSGVKAYEQQWSLEPTASGSRFAFMEEVELPYGVLGKLLGVVAQRMSAATVDKMQATLKALVEA